MAGTSMLRRSTYATIARAGFTTVELIVVIVIIGILFAVAYPRIMNGGFDEAGYRDQVAASLSFARKAAVAQRRNVQVTRNGSALSFRIANDIPEAGTGFTGSVRPLILPGSSTAQIAPSGATTLSGPATLDFSAQGKASATSFVYTISGSTVRTLTVDSETGYVY